MSKKLSWCFPPTSGGLGSGFNDSGIAHFAGDPLSSLARETIQNSLDAALGKADEAVCVLFELIDLDPGSIGKVELQEAIIACINMAKTQKDSKAVGKLKEMKKVIASRKISCLRVSDRNTEGLHGKHWSALVKMQGYSCKELEGAGGSHGIGKFAPFAVSELRTVFYWTYFLEGNKGQEKFQGKSVLMSHKGRDGKETQGTGFFGIKEGCRELTYSKEIPKPFRVLNKKQRPVQGTSLVVAGYRETDDWRGRVAASVIKNFFFAIEKKRLTVIVEPGDEEPLMEIEHTSLDAWFQYLEKERNFADSEDVAEAKIFWQLSKGEPHSERQDEDFGHCKLWISVAENFPSKVAFVRRTGMLVTTQQKGLIRFSGFRDFAALCVFEDPKGNEFLRHMENPQHDKFEPNRLPRKDRERGRKALRRITKWIREEIRKKAGPLEGGKSTILSELANVLPDYQPEESFDDAGHGADESDGEPGFGERAMITLKPVRRPASSTLQDDSSPGMNGVRDSDDFGNEGGAGTGSNGSGDGDGGSGEGDGKGGTGSRGGDGGGRRIPVSGVRLLPIAGRKNHYRLSFMAGASGAARLMLNEAGDSSIISRKDVRAAEDKGMSLDRVPLTEGKKCVVEIVLDGPIDDRAWCLTAAVAAEEGQS